MGQVGLAEFDQAADVLQLCLPHSDGPVAVEDGPLFFGRLVDHQRFAAKR
jgi:hypothetical protein